MFVAPFFDLAQLDLIVNLSSRRRGLLATEMSNRSKPSEIDNFASELRTSDLFDGHQDFAEGTRSKQSICDNI